MSVAILDIDGTLVDTNYHHAIAWYRAFHQHGIVLPVWRIHRHLGMGGDQVVEALTDEQTEEEKGDEIRETEKERYFELIDEVSVMHGARELIKALKERGHTIVLASSAKEDEVERYLDLLDARDLADGWTTSADVEETKPQPDLVNAALKRGGADADDAVMIGDTPWDIHAARKADVGTIAVLTGGFAIEELSDSGAIAVFESIVDLCEGLDDTPLA
ncbi:MAG: HAD family hydrolase [Actinomycetota bacterium]|nr:HAD family hydrolase [Actinomycetota bacterium]